MSNQYVQTQVVCAQCAAVRRKANRWFEFWEPQPSRESLLGTTIPEIKIYRWKDGSGGPDFIKPACGELCLLRLVAKNLEKL